MGKRGPPITHFDDKHKRWRDVTRVNVWRRKFLKKAHSLICDRCDKPITKMIGQDKDSLVTHHVDGNHGNNIEINRRYMHHNCHSKHHQIIYIGFQNLFRQRRSKEVIDKIKKAQRLRRSRERELKAITLRITAIP